MERDDGCCVLSIIINYCDFDNKKFLADMIDMCVGSYRVQVGFKLTLMNVGAPLGSGRKFVCRFFKNKDKE